LKSFNPQNESNELEESKTIVERPQYRKLRPIYSGIQTNDPIKKNNKSDSQEKELAPLPDE
jgi:hypothetical protein